MRRALSESVEAIGGSVTIRSAPGKGTEIALSVPLAAPRPTPPQPGSAFDVLLSPISVRMAMLSVAALGLLFIVPVSATFTTPWLLVGTYILLVATVTTIAFLWDRPMVGALGWLSLALVLACQAIAWTTQQGCVSSPGLHLMVFSASGTLLLPILAQRSVIQGSVMLFVVIASTIILPSVLPEVCRSEVLIPAVEEAAWLVALIGIIAVLSRAVDRASARDAVRWAEIAQATARRLASDVVQQRWQSVDGPTRELLTAVATGMASPDDPGVRSEAAHLESRLRSLLETSKITSEDRRDSIDEVIERVSASGASISVLVLDSGSKTRIPQDVVDIVLAVAEKSADTGLHLTLLDDELLIAAPRDALRAAGCPDLDDTEDPRTAITSLRWSADVHTG